MATVVTASPSLSRVLIAGQTVQGTVTAAPQAIPAPGQGTAPPSAGSVTIQTTFGTITLRLPIAVPPGSGLTLTTTGKAPLQTVQVSFTAPGSGNPAIPGQAAGPQAAPTPSAAGVGTGIGTGAGAKTIATATNPAQGPAGAAPSAQSNAATAGSIAAGSTVPVRLAAILPPGTPAPAVAGLTNSAAPGLPVVIGSVIGETASGAALVRTPLGHFSVPVGSRPVPSGTALVLEFTAQPTPPAAGGAVHAGQAVARQVGGGPFQALQEALALLQQADPGAAQQIAQSLIPTAGPQLGTALLFLLQAVRLGGAPRWLGGDAVRTLERTRRGSVDRLSRDLGALRGKAMDSAGGEWRSYQLPVSVGGEIEALKLYLRDKENQAQDEGREKTKTGQRFIIEVNFTRLGPFQFDNIVEKKHIDLMIRTHAALPSDMRRDIQTLFADTVTALGLTGQVGYHVVKSFDLTAVDGPSGSDGVREDLSI
ncbi:hypothetical protein [Hwanghaeella sp.]|uniref:hypothetical protein n=1 Tax=Hwanghaeella sp. TaxID=2605943 RepID=UPI003CCBD33B